MTIQITKREVEALINQGLQTGTLQGLGGCCVAGSSIFAATIGSNPAEERGTCKEHG